MTENMAEWDDQHEWRRNKCVRCGVEKRDEIRHQNGMEYDYAVWYDHDGKRIKPTSCASWRRKVWADIRAARGETP